MMRGMALGDEHHISKVKILHAVAEIDNRSDSSVFGKSRIRLARIYSIRHHTHVAIIRESH